MTRVMLLYFISALSLIDGWGIKSLGRKYPWRPLFCQLLYQRLAMFGTWPELTGKNEPLLPAAFVHCWGRNDENQGPGQNVSAC